MKRIPPFIIFILLVLGMSLFPYIPIELFHINIQNFSQSMLIAYSFCTDIGFMIIVFFMYKDKLIKEFKEYFSNFIKNFRSTFGYYIIGFILMVLFNSIINNFLGGNGANNETMIRSLIHKYPLYMLFSVAIYAPFIEEIIFRRSIKDIIKSFGNNKITKYTYIIISGLIFAAMHVIGTASSTTDYLYIIPYMSLGIVFAYIYDKTDNLFSTIVLHSFHNTMAVILYFIVRLV